MRYLSLDQVIELHRRVTARTGGAAGIRDGGALESAIAQPAMTFDGVDLYPTLAEKVSALAHAIVQNHPFIDGNKRTGHAAMEVLLVLNGYEIGASVDEQEALFLNIAAGRIGRDELARWIAQHMVERK